MIIDSMLIIGTIACMPPLVLLDASHSCSVASTIQIQHKHKNFLDNRIQAAAIYYCSNMVYSYRYNNNMFTFNYFYFGWLMI